MTAEPKVLKCIVCEEPAHGKQFLGSHYIWCAQCIGNTDPTDWAPLFLIYDPSDRISASYIQSDPITEKLIQDFFSQTSKWVETNETGSHSPTKHLNDSWGFQLV